MCLPTANAHCSKPGVRSSTFLRSSDMYLTQPTPVALLNATLPGHQTENKLLIGAINPEKTRSTCLPQTENRQQKGSRKLEKGLDFNYSGHPTARNWPLWMSTRP